MEELQSRCLYIRKGRVVNEGRLTHRILLVLALLPLLLGFAPQRAEAAFPSFVTSKKGSAANIATLSAKEKNAYKRAYNACMRYASEDNPIVVDMSNLGLTTAQARHVQYLLHSNGELFFIDTYNDKNFTAKKFTLRCTYDDATITKMRGEIDTAVKKAMKRVTPQMDAATKILTLHDYLIDVVDYVEHQKTAYTGLVKHQADCMGYAQTMDLMLRRAGFTTDMAYSYDGLHIWNLVKLSGRWYHIDLTWDQGYSGRYLWKKKHCHLFLLQDDARMASNEYEDYEGMSHGRWWAHYKCSSKTYRSAVSTSSTTFAENKYKLYVSGFTVGGIKYKRYGVSGVQVASVATAKKRAAGLVIPATVTYKGTTYKVVGIAPSAFAQARAKTLAIETPSLTAARIKGCLTGSKVKTIKLKNAAARKKTAYKKAFTIKNTGATATLKIV